MAAGLASLGIRLTADWQRGEIRVEGAGGRSTRRGRRLPRILLECLQLSQLEQSFMLQAAYLFRNRMDDLLQSSGRLLRGNGSS